MYRLIGLALSIILLGCEKSAPLSQPPRPVLVSVVGNTPINNNVTLVGEVRPRYESEQSFRIDGKIIERKVDVGDQVKKGQVIARLDASDPHLSANASQANVNAAAADYERAVAEINRQRQLYAKKFISASALDIQEANFKTASARLAQAKAQADLSDHQKNYTQLSAERDGVVTMIHAEPGQVIKAGDLIAKIADTQAIEVLVSVPESRLSALKPNENVSLRMWADRGKIYSGRVREIAPSADSNTRTFNVRVAISDADNAIKLGMTAEVKFNLPNPASDVLIPSSALTQVNGQTIVWLIDGDKAHARSVVAGMFREDGVLISEGLKTGDKIAIAGVHTLIENQVVKAVEVAP